MSGESIDIFRRLCDFAAHLMMDAERFRDTPRGSVLNDAGRDMLRAAESLYRGEMSALEAWAQGSRRLIEAA